MKIVHFKEAIAVAALVGVAWAGPAAFAAVAPSPKIDATNGEPIVLDGSVAKVSFDAPEGWRIAPGGGNEKITLAKDDSVLIVEVMTGADGTETSLSRAMLNLNRRGISAVWDQDRITVPKAIESGDKREDLKGQMCTAIDPATVSSSSRAGSCAIASGNELAIMVIALGAPVEEGASGERNVGNGSSDSNVLPEQVMKSMKVELVADSDQPSEGGDRE
ncbi:hypothetical protein [Corynebacterium lactis]|uniref:hypothetical protein n=1 Tax=Corynebacterium lactis TaxID=1231000 RepID=UPI000A8083C2|nr:hypothetical protein [Corynebacterium lactis]